MNRKTLFISYAINIAVHYFALGLLLPVMILVFLDRGFGLDRIGEAMAIMSFTVIILELPTGGFADALGRKKIYMISLIFNICGYTLLLTAHRFIALAGVTLLKGIGRALSSGSIDAWFIDEHKQLDETEETLQQDIAKAGIIIPGSLGAGTLLGGFLPDLTGPWVSTHTEFGLFGGNILLIIFLYSCQFLLTGILIKEDKSRFQGSLLSGFKEFPKILGAAVHYGLKKRNTLAILLATAALGVGLSGLEGLWQPRIRVIAPETGIWIMGFISAGYFLAAAGGNGISTGILRITGYKYKIVLFIFRLLMGLLYLALSFSGALGGFIPLYVLLFLAHGVTGSPEMTLFNRDIPSEKRSTLLSLNSLFLQGGGALGSLTFGYIAEKMSIPPAWQVAAAILIISAFFYLMIQKTPEGESHENQV